MRNESTALGLPHHDNHKEITMTTNVSPRYLEPDALTRRLANPIVSMFTKLGISLRGSRMLMVRGRTSGEWRSVPVNPLALDGEQYLVAPRGHTHWVRNMRAAGGGQLRIGRRIEAFTVTELADAAKAPIIRAYLDIWSAETERFFDGITKESPDADIDALAPGFPVFRIN
jgi:deazaflavin-dependent oxidoreductase (nitroreductase family)